MIRVASGDRITQASPHYYNSLLCAVGFWLPWEYLIFKGQYESSRAGVLFVLVLITEVFSVTLGQAVAALSPSIFVAALFNPFLLVIFSLFCGKSMGIASKGVGRPLKTEYRPAAGVTIPQPNLNVFWRYWLYYVCLQIHKEPPADLHAYSISFYQLNPFTWLVSGMTATALHDLPVVCVRRTSLHSCADIELTSCPFPDRPTTSTSALLRPLVRPAPSTLGSLPKLWALTSTTLKRPENANTASTLAVTHSCLPSTSSTATGDATSVSTARTL